MGMQVSRDKPKYACEKAIEACPRYCKKMEYWPKQKTYQVNVPVDKNGYDDPIIEWIIENTRGRWSGYTPGRYYFARKSDAAIFKLVWQGFGI